ncbi:hypothetical protein J3R30DRAFT_2956518 [Lentinula aciculospora]|uniref:Uncharacterized protein n=1 Tax=Lentinula aciculospora TaxID=153920 RepID=A0A9W8ZRL7_9AGAR|nr:hypothetical protein J3R30DRAFT_2956518 [Lentinula aciculospora]
MLVWITVLVAIDIVFTNAFTLRELKTASVFGTLPLITCLSLIDRLQPQNQLEVYTANKASGLEKADLRLNSLSVLDHHFSQQPLQARSCRFRDLTSHRSCLHSIQTSIR